MTMQDQHNPSDEGHGVESFYAKHGQPLPMDDVSDQELFGIARQEDEARQEGDIQSGLSSQIGQYTRRAITPISPSYRNGMVELNAGAAGLRGIIPSDEDDDDGGGGGGGGPPCVFIGSGSSSTITVVTDITIAGGQLLKWKQDYRVTIEFSGEQGSGCTGFDTNITLVAVGDVYSEVVVDLEDCNA